MSKIMLIIIITRFFKKFHLIETSIILFKFKISFNFQIFRTNLNYINQWLIRN